MIKKIKKTNLILGLLVIAFFIVSLSLILEILTSSPIIPKPPTIIEIEGHIDTLITHGGSQWPLGCVECHFEPVYGECTDPACHPSPDYWVGDDNSTYFPHHDLSYIGFKDCWSSDSFCHDPNPEDVRTLKGDLVEGNDWTAWHTYCMKCHADMFHK